MNGMTNDRTKHISVKEKLEIKSVESRSLPT